MRFRVPLSLLLMAWARPNGRLWLDARTAPSQRTPLRRLCFPDIGSGLTKDKIRKRDESDSDQDGLWVYVQRHILLLSIVYKYFFRELPFFPCYIMAYGGKQIGCVKQRISGRKEKAEEIKRLTQSW